jgi:hypothetical protein
MSKKQGDVTYKTDDLEKKAVAVIEAHGLVFLNEVCAYLPCATSTFYEHNLEKSEAIKEALNKNKVSKKVALRSNWEESTNATLQMGLYKLLATPEELAALSMQHIDLSTKGESLNEEKRFVFSDGTIRDAKGNVINQGNK